MNVVIYRKSNGEIMRHMTNNSSSVNSVEVLQHYLADNEVSSDDFGTVEIADSDWIKPTEWINKIIDINTGKLIVNPNYTPEHPKLAFRTIPFTDISILK